VHPPDLRAVRSRGNPSAIAVILIALALFSSACGVEERRPIRLAPTSTADPGVRVIVDNCPGPTSMALAVRDEVLWQIDATAIDADSGDGADATADTTSPPGLREFLVGETPDGWVEVEPLQTTLTDGIRYTLATEPDGQSVDFSLPDLAAGLLFDGTGRVQFNPNLIDDACSEPADIGAFARDLGVLAGLLITSAALVMVTLILVLFVVTRRFSRIRSIERRARVSS
jgi:hypothetical protein